MGKRKTKKARKTELFSMVVDATERKHELFSRVADATKRKHETEKTVHVKCENLGCRWRGSAGKCKPVSPKRILATLAGDTIPDGICPPW